MRKIIFLSTIVFMLPTLFAQDSENGFVRIHVDDLEWTVREGGTSFVVLYGDPSEPGFYIQRNRFPPGAFSTPHYHDQDRLISVISGTWYTGVGAELDKEDTVPLPPGSYMVHPAGGWHYDGAIEEEVVVEIRGMGPVRTIFE